MQPGAFDIDAYLERIGHAGSRHATASTLAAIAWAHALAIPFENLGVLTSGAPPLEVEALEAKLVHGRRGGYCYEQNGLLRAALESLGFDVLPLSARVRYAVPPDMATPRSHMVLCVTVDAQRMLVDAGFGGLTLTSPVKIDEAQPQSTPHETVRILEVDGDRLLQARVGGRWRDVYRFDFVRQLAVDYVQQNWHTATRPGALFANNVVAARPVEAGRYTLFNRTLNFRDRSGHSRRTTLSTRDELRATLETVFGIRPTDDELSRAWTVAAAGDSGHPGFG